VEVWIDAQLPPSLAEFLRREFGTVATHVVDLGLVSAKDRMIFGAARTANAGVVTKDQDFVRLLEELGPPPRVLWITTGNINNADLCRAFATSWLRIEQLFAGGERLVELGAAN
jgi:predicted nuclease of predicted toxin-antitoxin system